MITGAFARVVDVLHRYFLPALIVVWALQVSLALWFIHRMQATMVETSALHGAALQAELLAEFRSMYTEDVVERMRPHGIDVRHDFRGSPRAIPLPATFTIELGRRLEKKESGVLVQLFSEYPFPWRTDGGPQSDFDCRALAYLRENPEQSFHERGDRDGAPVLRYAIADRMRKECIDCHNNHPASPKTDWQEGDVRGALKITRPLAPVLAKARTELRAGAYFLGILTALGLAGLGLVIGKMRGNAAELEKRVTERTERLQQAHQDLHAATLDKLHHHEEAAHALGKSEAFVRLLLDSTAEAIYGIDLEGNCTFANPSCARLLGHAAPADLLGQHMHRLMHHSRADGSPLPSEDCRIYQAFRQGQGTHQDDDVFWRADGSKFHVEYWSFPVRQAGQIVGAVVTFLDISPRKHIEEQLRQAQKMEAIGQLAGGVAHDFNNILTAIIGHTQFILDDLPLDHPLYGNAVTVQQAAERATALTRQLLAFSRRQVQEPKVLDIPTVVRGVEKILKPLVGEHIEVATDLAPDVGRVKADASQIEQVVMNLVINSRDAMPEGGKVTIEARNIELDEAYASVHLPTKPGSYVMLAVSDTGCGMDKETQSRIFEPFFTTKPTGQGTGLGLATVYGIVKQSSGYIWVYSEPGQGTTFRIYLPRVEEPIGAIEPETSTDTLRGSETVLVVEDETAVRELVSRLLIKNGYTVLAACHGVEALELGRLRSDAIHLVITDVVMPNLSGRAFVDQLRKVRPEVHKVLFMSGYTANFIPSEILRRGRIAFVRKPFTEYELLRAVRSVLDTSPFESGIASDASPPDAQDPTLTHQSSLP